MKETELNIDEVLKIKDKNQYIREMIIPKMMVRMNRTEPLTRLQILDKIFGVPYKEGEQDELLLGEVIPRGFALTGRSASELADIAYYTHQENCPPYLADPSPLFSLFGVTPEQARIFCILKYGVRLVKGDQSDHKELENDILDQYLNQIG